LRGKRCRVELLLRESDGRKTYHYLPCPQQGGKKNPEGKRLGVLGQIKNRTSGT